jgi:putative transposase
MREAVDQARLDLSRLIGADLACRACPGSRAGFFRDRHPKPVIPEQVDKPPLARGPVERALTETEKANVRAVLHSERYADAAPREVYASLLGEGVYHCSVSTMYRILRESNELNDRRNQLRHVSYTRPELLATRPNQVWSWDITKLKADAKWCYYYLYVVMDIYSRYVVAWCLATKEDSSIARQLIFNACLTHNVKSGQLTIHADRGSSMTSKAVSQLLIDLDVTKTHSRPHVSNDNCYSEAQFKTLKYRPDFPERFANQQIASSFCSKFFEWYNTMHKHSGIAMLTPETVHLGRAQQEIDKRQAVLDKHYDAHPSRFVRMAPKHEALPTAVYINPPEGTTKDVPKTAANK